jgi:hypothetical protein
MWRGKTIRSGEATQCTLIAPTPIRTGATANPAARPSWLSLHNRSFLERAGNPRPIQASASEVVELSDRSRCENIASRERVFVTYVVQLGVTHVLPLRLPTPRRFCVPPIVSRPLLRHGRKDNSEAEGEPGERPATAP